MLNFQDNGFDGTKQMEASGNMKKALFIFLLSCLAIGLLGHLVVAFVVTG
ncbi:hypothetical protein Agau_C200947 [Agrobacterium tumefaciens F2]|jgi:hypothetical protein|nr:hypothetical protein Agau_C200947 [Agrobacterium tumefaciens F2]